MSEKRASNGVDSGRKAPGVQWPDGKRFAFTIFDDTDLITLENGKPIYEVLTRNGFRTTKSVWPLPGSRPSKIGGATCDDPAYFTWVRGLKSCGFEIGLHNATYHSSTREECLAGLEKFKEYFGALPVVHANHFDCADGLYWGPHRFTGINRVLYTMMTRGAWSGHFQGHIESSPYFWGDVCKASIQYVRDFVYPDINTLKACPTMPYHDRDRPYVNRWFASSEGANIDLFVKMISEENQDRLEREGGACIMYTHFGSGFVRGGEVDFRFKYLIERLGKKKGWFVPVNVLLDHLASVKGVPTISRRQRMALERKFLWNRAVHRLSS